MKAHLIIVDPQNDFCVADSGLALKASLIQTRGLDPLEAARLVDPHSHKGTLVVPGGDKDMDRTATMIRRLGGKFDDIHVTLDSHRPIDISHPTWWKRIGDGSKPAPFTALGIHPDGKRIVKVDFSTGVPVPTEEEYTTYLPSFLNKGGVTGKGSFGYLEALAAGNRYPHVIWPEHCIIGSWGHNVVADLHLALCEWEREQFAQVNYVTKGSNPQTEHFSGVKAEVPDPSDPDSQINTRLIQTLEDADIIAIAGEALSHCVASTVRDIAACFSDPRYIAKLVLLTDASSNVAGFDFLGDAFMKELLAKGMKTSTTVDFLA
jgi:nicotinamidase-related amidase